MMRTRTLGAIFLLAATAAFAGDGTVTDTGPAFVLANGQLKATISKTNGCVTSLEGNGMHWDSAGFGRLLLYPPLEPVYGGPISTPLDQKDGKAEVRKMGEGVHVMWTSDLGTLEETINLDGAVLYGGCLLTLAKPAFQATFLVDPTLSAAERDQCVFLPDKTALRDVYRQCGAWEVLSHEPSGRRLGVLADGPDDDYLVLSDARMAVQLKPLHFERQKQYHGLFSLYLGANASGLPADLAPGKEPFVDLLRFQSSKLIYAPGEAGQLLLTLRSVTPTDHKFTVQVLASRGLADAKPVVSQEVTLPAFAQQTVSIPWQPGTAEGGIGLDAKVLADGKVTGVASDACIVTKNWSQYFQLGIVYPTDDTAASLARTMRDSYLSVGHCFAWSQQNGSLTPDTDKYISSQGFEKSKLAFLRFNQEMHARGLKTNFYWDLFPNDPPGDLALAAKDPTTVLYEPSGQPFSGMGGLGTDPYLQWSRDFVVRQFKASIAMFGWDSMMFDCVTYFAVQDTPFTAFNMRNWKGEVAGKELAADPDTAGEKWLTEVKAGVRAQYPDFVFMGNELGPDGFLSGTGMGPKTYAATEIPLSELGGGGADVAGKTGVGTWAGLKQVLDIQHAGREGLGLGNKPNYVYIPIPYGGEESTKGSFALLFANRHHLYGWWPAPAGSLFAQAEEQYLRFATRFCEFIYSDNAKWYPPDKVDFLKVEAPAGVAWREYVYERPRARGRELLVHLVQQPHGEYMWRQSTPPETLKNLPVQLTLGAGEKVSGAWLLSPDREPERVPVPVQAGAPVRLTVPELTYYGVLVVEVQAGG